MGKRKDKMIVQGSRRRHILQLDDESNHGYANQAWQGYNNAAQDNSAEEVETEEDKKAHQNPLSGLLSHYMDSEEEVEDAIAESKATNGVTGETSGSGEGEKSNRIDLEVADFLKEIDALTTTSEEIQNEKTESKPSTSPNPPSHNGSNENSREASSSTGPSLSSLEEPSAMWQECFDETTGYTYYWNTGSNQVTWECPEEYHLQSEKKKLVKEPDSVVGPCNYKVDKESHEIMPPKNCNKKEVSSDEEGKIEPITFYGPSSSNEDSSSDDDIPFKPRRLKKTKSKEYGPTHPNEVKPHAPNFGDDPSSPTGIGPQLPSGYIIPRSDSPELMNPQLATELAPQPIMSQEVQNSVCEVNLPADMRELSPSSTANASNAIDKSNDICLMDESESPKLVAEMQDESSDMVLPDHVNGCLISHANPVAGSFDSHMHYMDVTEEPDSTTRSKQNKIDVLNCPAQPSSPETGRLCLRTVPQALADDSEEEIEEDPCSAQATISSSGALLAPSYFEDEGSKGDPPVRQGFGFKKQKIFSENNDNRTKSSRKKSGMISFVKAETLDLNEINRQMATEWSTIGKERPDESNPESANVEHRIPALPQMVNEENDIDEIDRELDLALERKKKNTKEDSNAGVSASISSMATSFPSTMMSSMANSLPSPLSFSLLTKLAKKRQRSDRADDSAHKRPTLDSLQSDEITDLASVLFEHLNSLGVTEENISTLHSYYIQIKTRLEDWRNGALEPSYVLACLHQTEDDLNHQESGSSTPVWGAQWDRTSKRCSFSNPALGKACWDYPEAERPDTTGSAKGVDKGTNDNSAKPQASPEGVKLRSFAISSSNSVSSSTGPSAAAPTASTSSSFGNSIVTLPSHPPLPTEPRSNSPPPLPPGPDPAIPPPPPPPPDSPPPPPPDSTETEEGEILDMKVEDPSPPNNVLITHSADIVSLPLTPPPISDGHLVYHYDLEANSQNVEKEDRSFVISKPPVPSSLSEDNVASGCSIPSDFQMELSSFYSDITALSVEVEEPAPPTTPTISASTAATVSVTMTTQSVAFAGTSVSSTEMLYQPGPSHSSSTAVSSVKKEKKLKKTRIATGLVLKKKNMPSLVEKWKKIKQEQARHTSSSDEERVSTTRQFEDI